MVVLVKEMSTYGYGKMRPERKIETFRRHAEKTKHVATQMAYLPKKWFKKQEERSASGALRTLNRDDVIAITVMSIVAAATNICTKMMTFKRWSLLETADFQIYHPWSPYLYIIGSLFYIGALWTKGIKFWLAYFPAFLGLTYIILRLALMNEIITPDQLATFVGWFPDWLGGETP